MRCRGVLRRDRLKPVPLLLLALLAGGCFGGGGKTFTFGVAAEPTSLDGALAPDVESRRVIEQIFDGLVAQRPGTTDLAPALATSWRPSKSGAVWTFRLRAHVTFQDGTPLDSAAVCANFNRWHGFTGDDRSLDRSYYWQRVFGGFEGQPSLYRRCAARDPLTVRLELTRPDAAFLSALPLPAFTIASPDSLLLGQPVGTGPFRAERWTQGDRLVLVRNDDYWGARPAVKRLVFRVIPESDRLAALKRGDIDGFDFVAPQDVAAVRTDPELKLLERPPYDVGYATINETKPPMDKLLVRQAVAYGLDRQRLASSFQPRGSAVVADLFQPPGVFGYSTDAARFRYKPVESKRLLRLAGLDLPVRLDLWYPSGVSRPYLPDPEGAFSILARGLRKAGFKVVGHTAPWTRGYLSAVEKGKAGQLNLVGWTADFGDPNDFLGTFFSRPTRQFGFSDATLFALLARGRREPARPKRAEIYRRANDRVMEILPGVPLVHTGEYVALRANVQGYVPSAFGPELYAGVSVGT